MAKGQWDRGPMMEARAAAKREALGMAAESVSTAPVVVETDEEIEAKLAERFSILEVITKAAISGDVRAAIISGPPGLGKSFTVEKALLEWDSREQNHRIVHGYVRAPALFKLLYQHKDAGQVLVFDDADRVLDDEVSISLLKTVCDTTKRRRLDYLSQATMVDELTAEKIPTSFDFEGTVLFISNIDFDVEVAKNTKLSPHLSAMMSRAQYLDLAMKTKRDYIIRIRQVVKAGLLASMGLNFLEQKDVLDFIDENQNKLRKLDLRTAQKIATWRKSKPIGWQAIAKATCLLNG